MSWTLRIVRAKPNPKGKDLDSLGSPKPEKVLGEWVDIYNQGDAEVNLSRIHLCHQEFLQNHVPKDGYTPYWNGGIGEILKPGQSIRVHTGKKAYSYAMDSVDATGVNYHSFAEKGHYVLNNACGDTISLFWKDASNNWQREDLVKYAPNPPDGAILIRSGDMLVHSYAAV